MKQATLDAIAPRVADSGISPEHRDAVTAYLAQVAERTIADRIREHVQAAESTVRRYGQGDRVTYAMIAAFGIEQVQAVNQGYLYSYSQRDAVAHFRDLDTYGIVVTDAAGPVFNWTAPQADPFPPRLDMDESEDDDTDEDEDEDEDSEHDPDDFNCQCDSCV